MALSKDIADLWRVPSVAQPDVMADTGFRIEQNYRDAAPTQRKRGRLQIESRIRQNPQLGSASIAPLLETTDLRAGSVQNEI